MKYKEHRRRKGNPPELAGWSGVSLISLGRQISKMISCENLFCGIAIQLRVTGEKIPHILIERGLEFFGHFSKFQRCLLHFAPK